MPSSTAIPDPALVVLVGASGSGKSAWAARHYRAEEVVSSDALRSVVGSGPQDLDASADAFDLLEQIVTARLGRGLTTVVDTLGLDPARRRAWRELATARGLPAVVVRLATPPPLCRERNAARDRPVPAPVLTAQLRRAAQVATELAAEGWDAVVTIGAEPGAPTDGTTPAGASSGPTPDASPPWAGRDRGAGPRTVLQVSRFPWGQDPRGWLTSVALAAEEAGFDGLALMDHLIQIPQVGRAWDPIPEPWVTLGMLAGLGTRLRLGTLVSPITFRPAGITAKAAATLDVLSGGRAFCGVGAGWWAREHAAYGLGFPDAGNRLTALAGGIETMRALWSAGTKAHDGPLVSLPETTGYPRPVGSIPVIVGGSGTRTMRLAAELGDGWNLPGSTDTITDRATEFRRLCEGFGRDPASVEISVLDVPVVGADRADAWRRVEALRGRTAAATFAARHHAGTAAEHAIRYAALGEAGVGAVFVALPDLAGPEDVLRLAPMARAAQ